MKAGWAVLPFDQVLRDVTGGNVKTLQSAYAETGKFPIIDQGQQLIGGYTDDPSNLCRAPAPTIVFGDHTRALKWIDFPFCLGADGTKILVVQSEHDPKYIFHYLKSLNIPSAGYSRHFKFLKAAKIVVPPLPDQRRIAAILDQADDLRRKYAAFEDALEAIQFATFREMFGDPNSLGRSGGIRLGDICEISSGSTPSRSKPSNYGGTIPWVKTGEVNGRIIRDTGELITESARLESGLKIYPSGTILMAMYGQGKTRGQVGMLGIPATTNQACAATICSREILPTFLFVQLRIMYDTIRRLGQGGNQPNLNSSLVKNLRVLAPSAQRQREFEMFASLRENLVAGRSDATKKLKALFISLQHRAFRGEL